MTCSHGSCRNPAAFLARMDRFTERPLCGACAEALGHLYAIRPIEGVPAWVARMSRNAKVLRAA